LIIISVNYEKKEKGVLFNETPGISTVHIHAIQ